MLGEISNAERRARRVPKGSVLITPGARGAVAGLQRRLRAADDVPASGQIVFRHGRAASQILR
ncbi:MAG TPA: hypothetical protein VHJ20_05915 [Polyangia bacterium]|nr:hypothetical protein [Polyangia bacterium]